MRIKFRKLFAALAISGIVVTGCSVNLGTSTENVVQDETVVFTFGSASVSKGEVYIYANSVKERYELCYGGDVWTKTVEELATSTDGAQQATYEIAQNTEQAEQGIEDNLNAQDIDTTENTDDTEQDIDSTENTDDTEQGIDSTENADNTEQDVASTENSDGADVTELSNADIMAADEGADSNIESLTREDIVDEIVKVKTLVSKKDDYNVEISDDEKQQLLDRAAAFYDGLNDIDKAELEITEDMAYQVLYENVIAGRVMDKILSDDSLEVSDEEARMTTFYDMCFACYSQDASGNIIPYSDEEKELQYDNALQACSMLATAKLDGSEDADSIDKLAAYYNLSEAREYTLSPEQILETYGQEIYDQIYNMENGDYSAVIESEYGYHVFEMIALTDQKATAANKEIIKKQRMDALLSDTLEKWESDTDENFSYPDSVNMDVYNGIKLAE